MSTLEHRRPPRWVYPFEAMSVGEQTFVADHGGLAELARRAVDAMRTRYGAGGTTVLIHSMRTCFDGVRGLLIRRVM